jgi:gamma-glutamyltranspeptidase
MQAKIKYLSTHYTVNSGFLKIAALLLGVSLTLQLFSSPAFSSEKIRSVDGYDFMVITPSPEATGAAYDILKAGGSAADAAIAAQLVLGLVRPQISGIGGGTLALYFDAGSGYLRGFDGTVKTPESAGKYLFIDKKGQPMSRDFASLGGRAVGVPGTVKLLEQIHKDHGRLAWGQLFYPAIQMSENGLLVSSELEEAVKNDGGRLKRQSLAGTYFYPDGVVLARSGEPLTNEKYALTLRNLANSGSIWFYEGGLAENMVKEVREAKYNPGLLSLEGLSGYEVKTPSPLCNDYKGYSICTMGEPSTSAIYLQNAINLLKATGEYPKDNENNKTSFAEDYIAVIDREGNAISMSSSIGNNFGSHLMVDGFLLNDSLTGFPFETEIKEGITIDNRVQAGTRAPTSMNPVMIFDQNGKLFALLGMPENETKQESILKTIISITDWGYNVKLSLRNERKSGISAITIKNKKMEAATNNPSYFPIGE